MAKKKETTQNETIWVLMDAPSGGDLVQYAGPLQIDAEKLGEQFRNFTSAISKAIEQSSTSLGNRSKYELTEITLEAKLSAEVGFMLVSKGSVEGTIGFKFERKSTVTAK